MSLKRSSNPLLVIVGTVAIGGIVAAFATTAAIGSGYRALLSLGAAVVCAAMWSAHVARESQARASWTPRWLTGWSNRAIRGCLIAIAIGGLGSYFDFGRFHGDGRFIHYHEFYHYTLGSKYFTELGYEGLYPATVQALVEDHPDALRAVTRVKNLRTYQLENISTARERAADVASAFSEDRWRAFKSDIGYFHSTMPPDNWRAVLIDHGFNATPFWIAVGSTLVDGFPIDRAIGVLASLDLVLLIASTALIAWAFGLEAALLVAIFILTNFFATFGFTGGAFLRQIWFAATVAFVCLSRRGQHALAGAALAIAVADRVFPLLFAAVPAITYARTWWETRRIRQPELGALFGFTGMIALLVALGSWATDGLETWSRFYANIQSHSDGFYLNQVSLRNLVIVDPLAALERADAGWDESLWVRERLSRALHGSVVLTTLRTFFLVLVVVAVFRERQTQRSWALVAFLPFVLLYPANYYYSFLALAVITWQFRPRLALAVLAWQGGFWLFAIALDSPLQLEALNFVVSAILAVVLFRGVGKQPGRHPWWYALPIAIAAGVIVGVIPARTRTLTVDLSTNDVESARSGAATNEIMTEWGNAWSLGDHLVCQTIEPGATLTLRAPIHRPGTYRVRIDFTTSPVFGVVDAQVGRHTTQRVDLYSPRLGIRSTVDDDLSLVAGQEIEITVHDKHPASTHYHFGIDRITFTPMKNVGDTKQTLERARTWVIDHPATLTDGGWSECGLEAVALEAARLDFAAAGPGWEDTGRYSHLPAVRESALGPRARVGLARLVDVVSRRSDAADGATFASWQGAVRRMRGTAESPLSMPLATTLAAQGVDLSTVGPTLPAVIDREYRSRELIGALAGRVDPRSDLAVRAALEAITDEVFAVTSFGRKDPPPIGPLANAEFMRRLFDGAFRWAMQRRDVAILSRLVAMAACIDLPIDDDRRSRFERFLHRHQLDDGSFGPTRPRATNSSREAVLMSILALSLLE